MKNNIEKINTGGFSEKRDVSAGAAVVLDVKTGEVWFTGTVYEPLNIEDEPEKERDSLATYEK